jgi:hypothetical protein
MAKEQQDAATAPKLADDVSNRRLSWNCARPDVFHDKNIIRTAEGKMDGQDNFMAVFVRKANPNSQYVIEVFELITSMLFDKPDQT